MPDLGWTPQSGYDVNLVTDNDFIAAFDTPSGSLLPSGAVVTLVLGGSVSWAASVVSSASSTHVSWNVDKATVNSVIAQLNTGVRVPAQITYSDTAGLDLTWTTGKVRFA